MNVCQYTPGWQLREPDRSGGSSDGSGDPDGPERVLCSAHAHEPQPAACRVNPLVVPHRSHVRLRASSFLQSAIPTLFGVPITANSRVARVTAV